MPPKQQSEQKLMAWQPAESAFICSLYSFNSCEILGPLSAISVEVLQTIRSGWDTKPNRQKGSVAAKYHLKFGVRWLISVLGKKVLPWQRGGWSGARTAACPLRSCLLRHEKSCAAIERGSTEVPGLLSVPLVAEALGAEEGAARSCPCIRGEGSRQGTW